jgi:hypothetical protein
MLPGGDMMYPAWDHVTGRGLKVAARRFISVTGQLADLMRPILSATCTTILFGQCHRCLDVHLGFKQTSRATRGCGTPNPTPYLWCG